MTPAIQIFDIKMRFQIAEHTLSVVIQKYAPKL